MKRSLLLQYSVLLICLVVLFSVSASSQDTISLNGLVQDVEGSAIEGAKIWVRQSSTVLTGESGENGAFHFEGLLKGNTEIVALYEGLAVGGTTVYMAGPTRCRITLEKPGSKTLSVYEVLEVIEGGTAPVRYSEPVPGAYIKSFSVDGLFTVTADLLTEHGFPLFRSNDEGKLVVDILPDGKMVQMVVGHDAYADSETAFFHVNEDVSNILLVKGASLFIRVLDENEQPVENAEVILALPTAGGPRKQGRGFTDNEGLLTLRASSGEYILAVQHPDFGPLEPQTIILASNTDEYSQIVTMPALRLVSGSVMYPDDEPAPGIRVFAYQGNTIYDDVLTGPDGRYSLRVGVPQCMIGAVPPAGFRREIPVDIQMDLGDTLNTKLSAINLIPLPVITGTVVDNDGEPVSGALISTLNIPAARWAITNEDGTFELRLGYMPEEEKTELRAEHPLRFLRRNFDVKIDSPDAGRIRLRTFDPEQDHRGDVPPINNIDPLIDKPAPALVCSEWFNSPPLVLEELKGKVVVLTFWAGFIDSPDGINRIHEMRALQALFKDVEDVEFIILHDSISGTTEVQDYIANYQITMPIGLDQEPLETYDAYGINITPQTVLIDKKGMLRYHKVDGRILELIKVLRREG